MSALGKYTLIELACYLAALNALVVSLGWKRVEYLTKPATLLVLLAGVFRLRPYLLAEGEVNWLALALIFSLLGDVLLMLPADLFIPGLAAFLLAHLAYIGLFINTSGAINAASIPPALLILVTSLTLYRRLAAGMTTPEKRKMRLPVALYTAVISVMVFLAVNTLALNTYEPLRSLLIASGALLFMLSDTWIAWDRFVAPLRWRDLRVMSTYHLAQIFLVLGSVLG
ncbi:MAG: lysoplasmalogenase [Anaerolineae bacterium]|nr:MAG: lysoplasmalogenase [Anaerolineae bacterium]